MLRPTLIPVSSRSYRGGYTVCALLLRMEHLCPGETTLWANHTNRKCNRRGAIASGYVEQAALLATGQRFAFCSDQTGKSEFVLRATNLLPLPRRRHNHGPGANGTVLAWGSNLAQPECLPSFHRAARCSPLVPSQPGVIIHCSAFPERCTAWATILRPTAPSRHNKLIASSRALPLVALLTRWHFSSWRKQRTSNLV